MRQGARQKLNRVHLLGDIMLASIFGLVAESWWVFFVALIILAGLDLHAGRIRPRGTISDVDLRDQQRRGEQR